MIPALTLRRTDGSLDLDLTERYAERASCTPARCFLISGTTGCGEQSRPGERAQLLSIWRRMVAVERLVACCWQEEDIQAAMKLSIQPMVVIRNQASIRQLLNTLAAIPRESLVYSHPRYSSITFDVPAAAAARETGVLPCGAKVSKISVDTVTSLRSITGDAFELWHGSSRNVSLSLKQGASGVVSTALSSLPDELEESNLSNFQGIIDRNQSILDDFRHHNERVDFLAASARRALLHPPGS